MLFLFPCQGVSLAHLIMNEDINKLIDLLKRKREAEGYSIRKLSTIIGISFSSLARIERGEGEPDNNSRIRILEWLGEDAANCGFTFQHVAVAHFRAAKNIDSKTIDYLAQVINLLKIQNLVFNSYSSAKQSNSQSVDIPPIILSKIEMEEMAQDFRQELGLSPQDILDPLSIKIKNVNVYTTNHLEQFKIDMKIITHLNGEGCDKWSAMSIPLDENYDKWAILRNNKHSIERQRITFLEECWHILLGHKLTKISKFGSNFGRTYEHQEEHDAYYLASATLLHESTIRDFIEVKKNITQLAQKYSVSTDLIEYRIKRLGLWRRYKNRTVDLSGYDN